MNDFPYPKGSVWRKWDLQIQTVLDDGYVSLGSYYEEIKAHNPTGWAQHTARVGGEENALLYDSKEYFNDTKIDKKERCINYVRNCFSFLDEFNPDLACIGITDHNYFDECLLDQFLQYSEQSRCKVIPGVEINCQGIHMLLFFPHNLYEKETFSTGIHTFLSKFNIHMCKTLDGVLTTTTVDIKEIIDEVEENGGIVIYPHCNSSNGLFQERTKTDRTHLADIFNHQKINLLQSRHNESSVAVSDYIKNKSSLLTSKFCCHISSDARSLRDVGRCDEDGNYLWIKADPTFEGLRQIVYEPEQRIFVGPEKPGEKKSYFVIEEVRFLDNTGDATFGSDPIKINQNLTTIIGGKSTGKSLLLRYIAKTIDRHEVENRNAAVREPVEYDFDDSKDFNFEVTWRDDQHSLLKAANGFPEDDSKERKILYIPQKYLNTLAESDIRSREALNEFVLNVILQDATIHAKYQETLWEIKGTVKSIPIEIGELFSDLEEMKRIQEELKETGDEKGIESYIEALQKQADEIKANSGLSGEQLTQYETLTDKEKTISAQVSNLEEDKRTINSLRKTLTSKIEDILSATKESEAYLTDPDIKTAFKDELHVVESFAPAMASATSNLDTAIDTRLTTSNAELSAIAAELAPLLTKIQLQSTLRDKTDLIRQEQQKLNELAIRRNSLKTRRASCGKKANAIIEAYKEIFAKHESLRNEFKKFESKFGDITLASM